MRSCWLFVLTRPFTRSKPRVHDMFAEVFLIMFSLITRVLSQEHTEFFCFRPSSNRSVLLRPNKLKQLMLKLLWTHHLSLFWTMCHISAGVNSALVPDYPTCSLSFLSWGLWLVHACTHTFIIIWCWTCFSWRFVHNTHTHIQIWESCCGVLACWSCQLLIGVFLSKPSHKAKLSVVVMANTVYCRSKMTIYTSHK